MENQRRLEIKGMKFLKKLSFVLVGWMLSVGVAHAVLALKVAEPKNYSQKTIIKMDLRNTSTNAIESARAVVFLLDDRGKVVGQETRWIVGGSKDRPSLAADSKATFNFVVQANKPFTRTKVTVTRIILEGGNLGDVNKDVQIETVTK